jgi:hypothetical protein
MNAQQTCEEIIRVKQMIRNLEDRYKLLTASLQNSIDLGECDDYINESGGYSFKNMTFRRCNKTTWRYSPAVKELQEKEQANNTAKQNVSTYLMVRVLDAEPELEF